MSVFKSWVVRAAVATVVLGGPLVVIGGQAGADATGWHGSSVAQGDMAGITSQDPKVTPPDTGWGVVWNPLAAKTAVPDTGWGLVAPVGTQAVAPTVAPAV